MLPIWNPVNIHTNLPKPKGYPYEVKTLGDAIKQKRLDERFSKVELANILDISPITLWTWEEKDIKPVPRMLNCLIAWLGFIPPLGVDENTLGGQLYIYRAVNGYIQEDISTLLKMDRWAVTKIENNEFVDDMHEKKIKRLINFDI